MDCGSLAFMMLVFLVLLREESALPTPGLQLLHRVVDGLASGSVVINAMLLRRHLTHRGDREHVGCRICCFGDSTGLLIVRETVWRTQGGAHWRSRLRILGIMVTDAQSLHDNRIDTEGTTNHGRLAGGERFRGTYRGEDGVGSYNKCVGGNLDEGHADD